MMRQWLIVLTALLTILSACSQDDEATDTPVTIMHIGEGITQGEPSDSTYRCFLDAKLHNAGVSFDFVGSRWAPYRGDHYACPTDFDQDHEAWLGSQIGGLETRLMKESVETLQPDIALIQLGGYDVWQRDEPLETAERLRSFIIGLQAVNPDITLLVANMIPCRTPLPWCTEGYPAFNDAIALFGDLSTDESTVMMVDMTTGVSPDLLRTNNMTFTDEGDKVMASRFMAALEESQSISTKG
jgi:hypothetical protein